MLLIRFYMPLGVQFFPSTMPCTRWSGFICCLRTLIPEYARNAASSAFFPSHGAAAACALRNKKSKYMNAGESSSKQTPTYVRKTRLQEIGEPDLILDLLNSQGLSWGEIYINLDICRCIC